LTGAAYASKGKAVDSGRHCIFVLDDVGWHRAKSLVAPEELTRVRLPPYSSEFNPMEQVWNYLMSN